MQRFPESHFFSLLRGFTRRSAPPRQFERRCAVARRLPRPRRPLTQAGAAAAADFDADFDAEDDEFDDQDDGDDAAAHTRTR